MAQWWAYYLFSVAVSGAWINWTIVGTVLLTLLFQGSTSMTENLSVKKYPQYVEYQRSTSRLLPWFPEQAKWSAATTATALASAAAPTPAAVAAPTSPALSPKSKAAATRRRVASPRTAGTA